MSACGHLSKMRWNGLLRMALVGGALLCAAPASAEDRAPAPQRVVSMNLCTDQLAMLLAAPDQLLSVSYLASDPRGSAMAEEAKAYTVNHGLAEEIYLLEPDLVIAGSFSTRATVDMLRRLGIPVVVMDPAYSLGDVRQRIKEMGAALHQEAAADAMIAHFNARLAALIEDVRMRPRAALYSANGYTQGARSLSGEIMEAAGLANLATELGLPNGGILPMEQLALSDPDLLIIGRPYPGASRAEAIYEHPVIEALRAGSPAALMSDRDWICGTPYVLRAIEELAADRRVWEATQ